MLEMRVLLRRGDRVTKALTGLTSEELKALRPEFAKHYAAASAEFKTVADSRRQRRHGAGRVPLLGVDEHLLMMLVYVKTYPTQDLLALLFGGTQAWACKWVHRLAPVLEATLGAEGKLPQRPSKRVSSLEELVERCPELAFLIDGTERPVRRPKDPAKQKTRYSGKKKRHTVKHTVVASKVNGAVLILGEAFDGSVHDKRMAETEPIAFPQGSVVYQDTGYEGYAPPGAAWVAQPRKKPRGKERSPEDCVYNREVSHVRIRVEHAIGGIKRAAIATDIFRNRKQGFEDTAMRLSAGLHNLRVSSRNYYANA